MIGIGMPISHKSAPRMVRASDKGGCRPARNVGSGLEFPGAAHVATAPARVASSSKAAANNALV